MNSRPAYFSRQGLFNLSSVVLLLLLVHELMLRWAANWLGLRGSLLLIISLWKDLALAGLLALALYLWWRQRAELHWFAFEWLLALLALIGLISSLLSPDRLAGLAAFRDYFEPLVLYVCARVGLAQPVQRKRWLHAWLVVGLLMAALGIWQALAWGRADYQFWGFGQPTSQVGIPDLMRPGDDLIRSPSTVTGPNELGTHMLLLLLVSLQLSFQAAGRRRLFYAAAGTVFLAGLALTYSRSNLLGLGLALVALIVELIFRRRIIESSLTRDWKTLSKVAMSLLALAFALVAVLALSGNLALLARTINSLGQQYHIRDTIEAISFLTKNPGGVGMGLVGPRQGFGFPAQAAYHVEGSLLQIAMEMGVWGLAVFFAFLVLALRQVWRGWLKAQAPIEASVKGTAFTGWLGALVAFTFLPLMQALPLMAWLWFLLGLGMSPSKAGVIDQSSSSVRPEASGSAR